MLILNCENYQTTLESLASLYNTSTDSIVTFLKNFELEAEWAPYSHDIDAKSFLVKSFEKEFGNLETLPDAIHWFHLTRALKTEKFYDGILPLDAALEKIWETLFEIFKDTEHSNRLAELKKAGVPNHHYKLKSKDPLHWGPYAMLIKDVAFCHGDIGNHDYLYLPEIIEDICNGYLESYGVSIHNQVVEALAPCIVKFKSNRVDNYHVDTAIYYLYHKIHQKELSIDTNTCFDGENTVIPKSDIIKVEFIDYTH